MVDDNRIYKTRATPENTRDLGTDVPNHAVPTDRIYKNVDATTDSKDGEVYTTLLSPVSEDNGVQRLPARVPSGKLKAIFEYFKLDKTTRARVVMMITMVSVLLVFLQHFLKSFETEFAAFGFNYHRWFNLTMVLSNFVNTLGLLALRNPNSTLAHLLARPTDINGVAGPVGNLVNNGT